MTFRPKEKVQTTAEYTAKKMMRLRCHCVGNNSGLPLAYAKLDNMALATCPDCRGTGWIKEMDCPHCKKTLIYRSLFGGWIHKSSKDSYNCTPINLKT